MILYYCLKLDYPIKKKTMAKKTYVLVTFFSQSSCRLNDESPYSLISNKRKSHLGKNSRNPKIKYLMHKHRRGIWVYPLMAYSDKMQEWYKVHLASGKIPLLCCSKEIPLVSTQSAPIRSRLIPQ